MCYKICVKKCNDRADNHNHNLNADFRTNVETRNNNHEFVIKYARQINHAI